MRAQLLCSSLTLCDPMDSVRFPRQEYWSGLPCPPPGDLLDPGIEPTPPAVQADSLPLSHRGGPLKGAPEPKGTNFKMTDVS